MREVGEAQTWLLERFDGLEPSDFGKGIRMIGSLPFRPPRGFQDVWIAASEVFTFTFGSDTEAVVIFCNPYDPQEVGLLASIVDRIDGFGNNGPCIIWAPHSVRGTGQTDGIKQEFPTLPTIKELFRTGLDGVIDGEPAGFHLALAVRARVCNALSNVSWMNEELNERASRVQCAEYLKGYIHDMLWDYLRKRTALSIPPLDPNLPAGTPRYLADYRLGSLLGEGSFARVYKLHYQNKSKVCNEVLKAVEKSGVKDAKDLQEMRRMIDVMILLSSPTWKHPNIVQLYQVYHTPTHILFRMENGGPENLYRRLYDRDAEGDRQRPLQWKKVCSLVSQAVEAMRHLHIGTHICHRDIKPENYIVNEPDSERIILKVADFGMATIKDGNRTGSRSCGTLPFSAPEVILEDAYDAFAADVWSLGITVLEILCGVRILEKALSLSIQTSRKADIAREIRRAFDEPGFTGNLLQENVRTELGDIFQPMRTVMTCVLDVDPTTRWSISRAKADLVDTNLHVDTSEVFRE